MRHKVHDLADHAAPEQHDDDDEQTTEDEARAIGQRGKNATDDQHDGRTQHRPIDGARSAKQRHHDRLAGSAPIDCFEADELMVERVERAGDADDESREHVSAHPEAVDAVADAEQAPLVLAGTGQ